jgi:hypothetical protein
MRAERQGETESLREPAADHMQFITQDSLAVWFTQSCTLGDRLSRYESLLTQELTEKESIFELHQNVAKLYPRARL